MKQHAKTLKESVAEAMDCDNLDIVEFLPYILQDFEQIGSSPDSMCNIILDFKSDYASLEVLDLGCGKGAVLLKIAERLHCRCLGIDAIPDFIDDAVKKAESKNLPLCRFQTGDARNIIKALGRYDVIILGSIGPVFGTYKETLNTLKSHLKKNGIIIIDDGYVNEEVAQINKEHLQTRDEIEKDVFNSGMEICKEYLWNANDSIEDYGVEFNNIVKRCNELGIKYPENKNLFDSYVEKQRVEYSALEKSITCIAWVIGHVK